MKGIYYAVLQLLEDNRHNLTDDQYRTLVGLCLHGDEYGALKGLRKLLNRSRKARMA